MFVHGEAGVGKTRLVLDACEVAERCGFGVLWGSCVRFGAAGAPYAPIVTALERWFIPEGATGLRGEVLGRSDDLYALIGCLDQSGDGGGLTPRLAPIIDRVLGRICADQPVVLVIDDLHWADETSLDVLAYVVAGFRRQRLLLVTTSRREALGVGHPLRGWLADLRRLPAVTELGLKRLDLADTEAQIAGLFGRAPDPGLVEDVYARSGGNAYFTELLVTSLESRTTRLPSGVPMELREALLSAWRRLAPGARLLAQLLAVGGRPLDFDELAEVAKSNSLIDSRLTEAMSEAVEAGVVAASPGAIWFRHPLLAEALYTTLLPGQARPMHAAFVALLQGVVPASAAGRCQHLAELALHHELAGNVDKAFEYVLLAADAAAHVQGYAEQTRQLGRAVELWSQVVPTVREAVGGLVPLLRRACAAAARAGDDEAAFSYVDRALTIVDRASTPLLAARLLCEWCGLVFATGRRAHWPLDEALQALALTSQAPDSLEHVLALATVSEAENWSLDRNAAREHADLAVEAASRCGVPEAIVWALPSRAAARWAEPSGLAEAEELYRMASDSSDEVFIAKAAVWRSSALSARGRLREDAQLTAEAFYKLPASAKTAGVAAFLAGLAADRLLQLGELAAADALVREGLALRAVGLNGARVRLAATRLAVLTGRLDDATEHLRRAEELVPALTANSGLEPHPIYASYLIASGRPERALDLLGRALPGQTIRSELLMWAARAAADIADAARDRRDDIAVTEAVTRLAGLVNLRASLNDVATEPAVPSNLIQVAIQAVFAAESGRCNARGDAFERWMLACQACEHAGLRVEEATACWRAAEALITKSGERTEIASLLRRAHRTAAEIGAESLRRELVALARMTRLSLREPVTTAPKAKKGRLGDATKRELEVLSHLVVGRTNAEIGAALFISDKTVSVHVSNLLRKSGTTNRHELTTLARRLGVTVEQR